MPNTWKEWIMRMDWVDKPVRPLVTYTFVAGIVWGFMTASISADAFLGIGGMAVGYYFNKRDQQKEEANAPTTNTTTPSN